MTHPPRGAVHRAYDRRLRRAFMGLPQGVRWPRVDYEATVRLKILTGDLPIIVGRLMDAIAGGAVAVHVAGLDLAWCSGTATATVTLTVTVTATVTVIGVRASALARRKLPCPHGR
eukprot:5273205-Pyramimonas_sp.AAC.2